MLRENRHATGSRSVQPARSRFFRWPLLRSGEDLFSMPEIDAECISRPGHDARPGLPRATPRGDGRCRGWIARRSVLRMLLRKGWLTSWQIDRLKKGDPSGFFYGDAKVLFHLAEGTFARVYRGEHIRPAGSRSRSRCSGSGSPRSRRRSTGSTRRPRPASGSATPTSSGSSTWGSTTIGTS